MSPFRLGGTLPVLAGIRPFQVTVKGSPLVPVLGSSGNVFFDFLSFGFFLGTFTF